jgi:hypothetical protein
MELILGLPPMSQYDAVADPILDWSHTPDNSTAYSALPPSMTMIGELNPELKDLATSDPRREMALESAKMDFTHADAAPALQLDQITWKTVKGPNSIMPEMRRTLPGPSVDNDPND